MKTFLVYLQLYIDIAFVFLTFPDVGTKYEECKDKSKIKISPNQILKYRINHFLNHTKSYTKMGFDLQFENISKKSKHNIHDQLGQKGFISNVRKCSKVAE